MREEIKKFEEFIKANTTCWSDTLELGLGVRFIQLNGEYLRGIMAKGLFEEYWKTIKAILPDDLTLIDSNANGSCMIQAIGDGTFYIDAILILVGSQEWTIADGEPIPFLDIPALLRAKGKKGLREISNER